ncbi:MAG TPA: PQQ-binding-like beta-propeller repeat protein, partial [Planctomycetia bacterium]|nr:PQQ-binding-like beta-propeller repeat protein [Planctomycetia bacterium]
DVRMLIDPFDGAEIASLPMSAATAGLVPAAAGGTLVTLIERNILLGVSEKDGKEKWRTTAPTPSLAPPLVAGDGRSLAAVVDRHLLWRIDPATGNAEWRISLANRPRFDVGTALGVAGDLLTTQVKGSAEVRRMSDGALVWSLPLATASESEIDYGWRIREGRFEILGADRVLGTYDAKSARSQTQAAPRLSQGSTVWAVARRP